MSCHQTAIVAATMSLRKVPAKRVHYTSVDHHIKTLQSTSRGLAISSKLFTNVSDGAHDAMSRMLKLLGKKRRGHAEDDEDAGVHEGGAAIMAG